MEAAYRFSGIHEIPWFLGEARPAGPTNPILQRATELARVPHSLDVVLVFLPFYHDRGRRRHYLAGQGVPGHGEQEEYWLDRADFDLRGEFQFVGVRAYRLLYRERAELLPIQSSGRPGGLYMPGVKPYLPA